MQDSRSDTEKPVPQIDELFAQLYDELRRIAHRHRLRGDPRETLRTTAVVNEAYVRLREAGRLAPENRIHFLALSARAMRFVLVDYARRWQAEKRGDGARPAPLDVEEAAALANAESTLAVHAALERMTEISPRLAQVVECRFFGGMTEAEIAELLKVSERTVRGDWQRAKLWLARELSLPPQQP